MIAFCYKYVKVLLAVKVRFPSSADDLAHSHLTTAAHYSIDLLVALSFVSHDASHVVIGLRAQIAVLRLLLYCWTGSRIENAQEHTTEYGGYSTALEDARAAT